MGDEGLEPATNRLRVYCSTIELVTQTIINHSILVKKNNSNYLLNQLEFYKLKYKTKQEYQLWQEGFHPQAILDEEMFRQKLDYIHNNPVKRGYIDDPAHWRYSSYRNYMGQPGLLQVELIDLGDAEPD